ncbi:hypothetical protein SLE2022_238070 [Rubroshorea leprosula]
MNEAHAWGTPRGLYVSGQKEKLQSPSELDTSGYGGNSDNLLNGAPRLSSNSGGSSVLHIAVALTLYLDKAKVCIINVIL